MYLVELAVDLDVREGWKEERILGVILRKLKQRWIPYLSVKEILSNPMLRVFLSDNVPIEMFGRHQEKYGLHNEMFGMCLENFNVKNELAQIEVIRLISRKVGIFVRMEGESKRVPGVTYRTHCYVESGTEISARWKNVLEIFIRKMASRNYLKQTESEGELEHKDIDAVFNSLRDIKRIEDLFPDNADRSNCLTNKEKSRVLLIKAIPALRELKESIKILEFLLELSRELDNLPQLICEAVEEQPLALLLIGGLLSFKEVKYDIWNRVKDDLIRIKEAHNGATNNPTREVIAYCYDDLSHFHQSCFLYLACYPIDYEIPARSLTQIWIAETLFPPEEGVTKEDTANNYREKLIQRSWVCVSKRSFSGPIKWCRVRQSILEFAIKQNNAENFFSINPEGDRYIGKRVAFYNDNLRSPFAQGLPIKKENLLSFLAFDCHRNAIKTNFDGVVLELRNSTIPEIDLLVNRNLDLLEFRNLEYLGLRGSNIFELLNIAAMWHLKTLDVRDTSIKTLPKSLWNIRSLRHVYVNYSPQIKGPPSTADISNLQTLKTVGIPESWLENFPKCLINLRKLALSNKDNQYWESISNLLSQMVNLLSMTIIGDNIVPSEFVDTRAFSNLETVQSIKLEGEWICRKLIIDNVSFPPNLTKLTLTKSGLKEDPMPRLERLQSLKYLSLQDGAYIGNKMVCSENGFPQLQFLELKKLEKLEYWEVNPKAMPRLITLRVVQCLKLENLPDLKHLN